MNWTPATVPNGARDVATFGVSNLTEVFAQGIDIVAGITFNANASPFTISIGGPSSQGDFTIKGPGVVNNSGITQNFVVVGFATGSTSLFFLGNASAGTNTVFKNNPLGQTSFFGTSTAGNAVFINHSGSLGTGFGGPATITFRENSTAGNATVTNEADEIEQIGGQILFLDNAAAANGFFTNKGEATLGCVIIFVGTTTAGTATFINEGNNDNAGATMQFDGTSSADHGTFTFEPGAPNRISSASRCNFLASATAAEAIFTIEGSTAAGAPPATLLFDNTSTAGDSVLIATNGPTPNTGGIISFIGDSVGGGTRIELSGPIGSGTLAIDSHNAPGVTIGSVEGAGLVLLGANELTVGTNNLSTTFSGVIRDGQNDTGGSLTKVGTGALTLSGANTYTGGTTIGSGTLVVANRNGSGTGTGAISVNAGTLGGSGIVTGAVSVGTGSGTGAFLAPAAGTTIQTRLTTQSALTLNSDATYTYSFKANSKHARTDMVIANGVTIIGATLALNGRTQGQMKLGLVLNVISNTGPNPISGTFSNLPDGGIVTVNGNNLQASYTGGDGNDLTLTVVP